jgi:uroporphyrinogen-III decarboxylase
VNNPVGIQENINNSRMMNSFLCIYGCPAIRGKDIVLFGGLGCQSTIPNGTPEDVVREAEERLAFLGYGGKYILGSSGSIPTETPAENVAALFEFCNSLEA